MSKGHAQKVGTMIATLRVNAGMSQEKLAESLGLSRGAIQSWETGKTSPRLDQLMDLFEVLGANPHRHLLDIVYPSLFSYAGSGSVPIEIESALRRYASAASPRELEEVMYLIAGDHGSNWYGLLQLMVAYTHLPLMHRVAICSAIWADFKMAESNNQLVCPDRALPDMDMLEKSLRAGQEAAMHGKNEYFNLEEASE